MNEQANTPAVLQIVGYSNAGKTTLLTELIKRLESMGIRVGVIKHNGGDDLDMDRPGKDSYRFSEAGASVIAVQSNSLTAFLERKPVPLTDLVARMNKAGAQIILVEGFKQAQYEKILVIRKEADRELLTQLSGVVALASWMPVRHGSMPQRARMEASAEASMEATIEAHSKVPIFSINDCEGLVQFVKGKLNKEQV